MRSGLRTLQRQQFQGRKLRRDRVRSSGDFQSRCRNRWWRLTVPGGRTFMLRPCSTRYSRRVRRCQARSTRTPPISQRATAGLVFRLNNMGYYDLLVSDTRGVKDVWFKVEKREYAKQQPDGNYSVVHDASSGSRGVGNENRGRVRRKPNHGFCEWPASRKRQGRQLRPGVCGLHNLRIRPRKISRSRRRSELNRVAFQALQSRLIAFRWFRGTRASEAAPR